MCTRAGCELDWKLGGLRDSISIIGVNLSFFIANSSRMFVELEVILCIMLHTKNHTWSCLQQCNTDGTINIQVLSKVIILNQATLKGTIVACFG